MYKFTDILEIKKSKTGVKLLRQWLFHDKELDEVVIAKVLSTTLTHILIEVENTEDPEEAVEKALGYRADLLATMIRNIVLGETTGEVIKQVLLKEIEVDRNAEV